MRKSSISSSCTTTPRQGRVGRSSTANFGGRPHPSSSGRNQRLSGLRLSGISMGRPSLAMVTALTGRPSYQETRAESKPQSDRSAFPKNLKSLIAFLNENQYPFPLNKLQSSPSAKDVNSIFEFLVLKILTDFNFKNKKFEDTFPQVLMTFRYPHTISKRQLQPVGSMHNWPTIVAGLVYITGCIKINKCLEFPEGGASSMNQATKNEIMTQFHIQPFNEYVDGSDSFDALDKEYFDKVPQSLGLDEYGYLKDLEVEVLVMEDKVTDIKNQTNELQERLSGMEFDYEKLLNFVEESETYHSHLDSIIGAQRKEAEELDLKLVSLAKEIQDREAIIANQKITPEEAMKVRQKIADMDSEVSRVSENSRKLREEISNSEADISKTRNEVVTIIERFNGIAETCQLIPATAENAFDYDYELRTSILDSDDSIQFIDIENRIDVIRKQIKSKARELNCKEMESVDNLHELSEMITKLKLEIADTETKIRREDELLEIAKQNQVVALQKLQSELGNEEKEIMNVKYNLKTTAGMAKMQSEVNERRKRYEELKLCCIEKAKERESFMVNAYNKVLNHKQRIQERIEKCATVTESVLKATKKVCHVHVDMSRLENSFNILSKKMTTLDL